MPLWASLIPIAATALLAVALVLPVGVALAIVCALALMSAVITAVHHAEVVAHPPTGTGTTPSVRHGIGDPELARRSTCSRTGPKTGGCADWAVNSG